MPLSAGEQFSGGVVRDADGREVVTVSGSGTGAGLGANTFTGLQTAPDFAASGLTGATATMRIVGATASGAPVSGTFLVGDAVLSLADGKWYTCTVAGTPGTWITPTTAGGGSAYDAAVMADSPAAYWLLNDPSGTTAVDATVNSNNGTYNGTYTLAQGGPCADGEKSVSMNSGYVTVPNAASLQITGDITMEAWVNVPSIAAYSHLLYKGNAAFAAAEFEFVLSSASSNPSVSRVNAFATPATAQVATGVWAHVAATITGMNIAYYLNGAANGTATGTWTTVVTSTNGVIIGTRGDLYTPFVGKIAKVAVYPSALSAGRIAAHYAAR